MCGASHCTPAPLPSPVRGRWPSVNRTMRPSVYVGSTSGVPDGHGHNYGTAMVDAFAAVLPPANWTAADTERVRMAVMASAAIDGAEK